MTTISTGGEYIYFMTFSPNGGTVFTALKQQADLFGLLRKLGLKSPPHLFSSQTTFTYVTYSTPITSIDINITVPTPKPKKKGFPRDTKHEWRKQQCKRTRNTGRKL